MGGRARDSLAVYATGLYYREVVERNVQLDHVHLLVMVPPKLSISAFVGSLKGRTAIRVCLDVPQFYWRYLSI